MRRSCADHGQESARPRRAVSLRLRTRTRNLVIRWITWAGLISSALPCWGLDGLDTGLLGIARQREIATRQLDHARAAVEVARSAAAKCKNELDQFLVAHFEYMRSRAAESLPEPRQPAPSVKQPTQTNLEAERLNAQINELKLRRDELLERYTNAHPEVADVEGRLGDLMLRLSALEPAAENAESLAPGDVVDPSQPADPGPSRQQSILSKRQEMAAEQYEQHVERWQAAEQDLKAALDAEEQAVARLAAIQLPPAPTIPSPAATPSVLTSESSVPAPAPHRPAASTAGEAPQQGSQPLALAALLIALAVAALAAVRLARSSSDVYFENVDDVAAALALPVVGVISAIDNAAPSILMLQPSPTRLSRHAMLACELLLAVIAFALVAYGVQNPAALWHVCTHPMESLGHIARFLAG
jgi:hypothetical protein